MMLPSSSLSRVIAIFLLSMGLTGCNSGPTIAQVDGTVTANGKPLAGIQVMFSPDVGKGEDGRGSSAVTDENGHYVLIFDDKKQPRPGAMVGRHKVVLIDVAWEDARDNPNRGARRVPDEYSLFGSTPLEFDVKPGAQTIPIVVK